MPLTSAGRISSCVASGNFLRKVGPANPVPELSDGYGPLLLPQLAGRDAACPAQFANLSGLHVPQVGKAIDSNDLDVRMAYLHPASFGDLPCDRGIEFGSNMVMLTAQVNKRLERQTLWDHGIPLSLSRAYLHATRTDSRECGSSSVRWMEVPGVGMD